MFSSRPPEHVPYDSNPMQKAWMRRTNEQLETLSRYQGVGVSGGTMPTEVVPFEEWIFGQIRLEGSGSGTGSGNQFSVNPDGVGFTDEEGYLAYAFDQIYDQYPWKGVVIENGITTILPHGTVAGSNYAYPLNSDFFDEGVNVILKRCGIHWVIIGTVGEASGSGGGGGGSGSSVTSHCPDGTSQRVRIVGNNIYVEE